MAIVLVLYSLTLTLGAYMGLRYVRGRSVPAVVAYGHGLCGIAATVSLAVVIWGRPTVMLLNDALFFYSLVIAAGLLMTLMRRKGIRPPMLYWAVHGVVAVAAFMLLLGGL